MAKSISEVTEDFNRLQPEEQDAMAHIVERLVQINRETPDLSLAERRVLLVELAREAGNASVIAAAEGVAGE